MGKRILIIHGWETNSREHFYPIVKVRLEKLGYEVFVPDMPNAFYPKKDEWVKAIESFHPDKSSILIGHSLGGTAILRFLETTKIKVSKCILMATPIRDIKNIECDSSPILHFFESEIGWKKIKENCNKFIILNQDRDIYGPVEQGREIANLTGGELKVVQGDNHFDTVDISLLEQLIIG